MQADLTVDALLRRIVAAAIAEIPGAQYAGITLVTGKEPATAAASGELVTRVDRLQYEIGEGPCLDAVRRHETVRCDDLRAEARWPRFARQPARRRRRERNLGLHTAPLRVDSGCSLLSWWRR
jgi:putative methionine-R-sulfoxide reductase with GAF domain